MKKLLISILIILLSIVVFLVSCNKDNYEGEGASQGLEFTLSEDQSYYILSGVGTCTDLDIVIPEKYNGKPVKSIGYRAFYSCDRIKSLEIPSGVESIGMGAFAECISLTSLTVPSSVTDIDYEAFLNDNSLTLYCESQSILEGWLDLDTSKIEVVLDYKNNEVATDGYIYIVENGIRYGLKDGNAILKSEPVSDETEINLPSTITYKGQEYILTAIDGTFRWCKNLQFINIPSTVTWIGGYAFAYCSELISIKIPESVTYIGASAFYKCPKVTIKCEAESQPEEWDIHWRSAGIDIEWGQ
ncbi:MAG: leucine-rich repeat domain-containing protein [Clostridia bacterium]|nr:leucine-rich repeat domain-containing protein [Clostridia bacterium]